MVEKPFADPFHLRRIFYIKLFPAVRLDGRKPFEENCLRPFMHNRNKKFIYLLIY
jgi:hypothetical protein